MRYPPSPRRLAPLAALFVAASGALLTFGCSSKKDDANLMTSVPTPEQQRQEIMNNASYTPEQKQRYLEQVQQREMASRMNPDAGKTAPPPGGGSAPAPAGN